MLDWWGSCSDDLTGWIIHVCYQEKQIHSCTRYQSDEDGQATLDISDINHELYCLLQNNLQNFISNKILTPSWLKELCLQ